MCLNNGRSRNCESADRGVEGMESLPCGSRRRLYEIRLPAVDRAINLLERLASATGGLTLSEVSRKLGIPKSSAHYLLFTLAVHGYVERSADGHHYTLGLRAFDFANLNVAEVHLQMVCLPHVQKVIGKLNLTTQIVVLRAGEGVVIAKVDPTSDKWKGTWVGRHVDLHCTAVGKCLIAHLTDGEIETLFRDRELVRFTAKTICSLEALKAHLAEVRAKGFALNEEEYMIGARSVGAPVLNEVGRVVASISVTGTPRQIPPSRMPHLGNELIGVAREISRDLLAGPS